MVFALRIWRTWILCDDAYSLTENFISLNSYLCAEINAHSLTLIILFLKKESKEECFLPWLFSSQSCESYFRAARSFSPVGSTRTNFTVDDFMHSISRKIDAHIRLMPAGQEDGSIHPRYGKHLESRYGGTSRFPIHPLPSILEIEAIVSKAKNDACSELQQLGVLVDGVSQFTFDSRLFIHLSSSTISVDEQDELEEICHEEVDEEEDDVDGHDIDLLNTLSEIDFKDFTNKVEHSTFMSKRIEEGNV